jgi:(1->4)-alpha-D-glucan 1-alpha-D-glucosylmutase
MLSMRRRDPKLFEDGSYRPLPASGSRSRNVLTFARVSGDRGIAVVAGRLFASLGLSQGEVPIGARAWGDTVLDAGIVPAEAIVTDVISGAQVQASGGAWPLSTVLAHFPGAVLSWGVVPEDGSA